MMRLRSINISLTVALGVEQGMEKLNYKLIMRVKQFNMEMVQFILWVCMISCGMDYMCKIKGEDNMSFAS